MFTLKRGAWGFGCFQAIVSLNEECTKLAGYYKIETFKKETRVHTSIDSPYATGGIGPHSALVVVKYPVVTKTPRGQKLIYRAVWLA